MAFHRGHITRFVAIAKVSREDGVAIMERVEHAVQQFDHQNKDLFSGSKLEDVLGNSELVAEFNDLWEKGRITR